MEVSWHGLDAIALAVLSPLTVWIVLSGIDDLFVDIVAIVAAYLGRSRKGNRPSRRQILAREQKSIAILVPLWQESAVIAQDGTTEQRFDSLPQLPLLHRRIPER